MNYRINPKNGDKLSALGFGCMRFAKDEKENLADEMADEMNQD